METIKIKYFDKKMPKLEKIEGCKSDWIDLRSAEDVIVLKGQDGMVNLGVAMELPEGYEAHVVPRSSSYKKFGFIQTNSIGIIDNSYCGDKDVWMLPIRAVKKNVIIHKYDRIAQFRIFKKQPEIRFEEVDSLGNESRGGFGSTGKN